MPSRWCLFREKMIEAKLSKLGLEFSIMVGLLLEKVSGKLLDGHVSRYFWPHYVMRVDAIYPFFFKKKNQPIFLKIVS